MAIGAAGGIALALQYGVPAATALIDLGQKWLTYWNSDEAKKLTQAEFEAKWAEMQTERDEIVSKHKALKAQGR